MYLHERVTSTVSPQERSLPRRAPIPRLIPRDKLYAVSSQLFHCASIRSGIFMIPVGWRMSYYFAACLCTNCLQPDVGVFINGLILVSEFYERRQTAYESVLSLQFFFCFFLLQ